MQEAIRTTILELLLARAAASSICPSDAARKLAPNNNEWRALMPAVREAAAQLASEGAIHVTQGDTTLSPDESQWRGAIRLRLAQARKNETRPKLKQGLAADEFLHWYWLKEELIVFCRTAKIPTVGQKPELTQRIAAYLRGTVEPAKPQPKRKATSMPDTFSLSSVIGEGWACNPRLGAFLREHCGKGFRFNAVMRDFIHSQSGKTLADAAVCYKQSLATKEPSKISPQNELNQHLRDFFSANPSATKKEAMDAWKAKRSMRRTESYKV